MRGAFEPFLRASGGMVQTYNVLQNNCHQFYPCREMSKRKKFIAAELLTLGELSERCTLNANRPRLSDALLTLPLGKKHFVIDQRGIAIRKPAHLGVATASVEWPSPALGIVGVKPDRIRWPSAGDSFCLFQAAL